MLFSRSVMYNSLWPHGLQHTSLRCPLLSPEVCSNAYPLMMTSNHLILCHPFSSCLQFFPASASFPMSWLFTSGGQSTEASASTSVLSVNIQDWFPLGLTGLTSLQSKVLLRVFSNATVQKHQFFNTQPSLWSNSHIHAWLPKLWLYRPLSVKQWLCYWLCCLSWSQLFFQGASIF